LETLANSAVQSDARSYRQSHRSRTIKAIRYVATIRASPVGQQARARIIMCMAACGRSSDCVRRRTCRTRSTSAWRKIQGDHARSPKNDTFICRIRPDPQERVCLTLADKGVPGGVDGHYLQDQDNQIAGSHARLSRPFAGNARRRSPRRHGGTENKCAKADFHDDDAAQSSASDGGTKSNPRSVAALVPLLCSPTLRQGRSPILNPAAYGAWRVEQRSCALAVHLHHGTGGIMDTRFEARRESDRIRAP
jgi:hypothetical protein